jgi:hypothetical protein
MLIFFPIFLIGIYYALEMVTSKKYYSLIKKLENKDGVNET